MSTSDVVERARAKSATIKERVDERSSGRKEERQRAREAELKEQELFLLKAKEVWLLRSHNFKVPMDILAAQWLSGAQSAETRLYLVENVLPSLIVGLEKLLQKADESSDEDFNSVNWLAQWLTRWCWCVCDLHPEITPVM